MPPGRQIHRSPPPPDAIVDHALATALQSLALECRRSSGILEAVAAERAVLARAALASWEGLAADEFRRRGQRVEAAAARLIGDLAQVAAALDRLASQARVAAP